MLRIKQSWSVSVLSMVWMVCSLPVMAGERPSRQTIETYIDRDVVVYGRYAAVRLPIEEGVTIWNPEAVTAGPDGRMYAANYTGEIYSLVDSNGDGIEDTAQLFCDVKDDGLRYPTSILFKDNDLYVATTREVRIYTDADGDGRADSSRTFFRGFPWTLAVECWTFGLCFGPDDYLYLNLTTDTYDPDPVPDPLGWRGAILRISPDGERAERYATGLRFSPGMGFNDLGDLFFSDNKGDENLSEELNYVLEGKFYGNNPGKYPGEERTDPLVKVKHGFAMGGLCFNRQDNDFDGTEGDMFIACWGPNGEWERGSIVRIRLWKQSDGSYQAREYPVAKSIAKIIDVAFSSDGDLYVAQFGNEYNDEVIGWHHPWPTPMGGIYRLIYAPWIEPASIEDETPPWTIDGNVDEGRRLFEQLSCNTCHAVDGKSQSLGPNLMDIARVFNHEELLQAIREPSKAIQVGHGGYLVETRNRDMWIGRLKGSNDRQFSLLMQGPKLVTVSRRDVRSMRRLSLSMMPEDLLEDLSERDINDLLAYLRVLRSE